MVRVSPVDAQAVLDRQKEMPDYPIDAGGVPYVRNRRLSPSVVSQYARDMSQGLWEANGVPLVFDRDIRLRDGQHRLSACVISGCSFVSAVVKLSGNVSFANFDGPKRRNEQDVAHAMGCQRAPIVVTTLRWVLRFPRRPDEEIRHIPRSIRPFARALSKSLQIQYRLKQVLSFYRGGRRGFRAPIFAALFFCVCDFGVYALEREKLFLSFLNGVLNGVGLNANSPELFVSRALSDLSVKVINEESFVLAVLGGWRMFDTGQTVPPQTSQGAFLKKAKLHAYVDIPVDVDPLSLFLGEE